MGHWCYMCNRVLPNEKFSGKGHGKHLCKKCFALPNERKAAIRAEADIFGYMQQKHISDKNVKCLKTMAASSDQRIAHLAAIVLEVARVKPYKKRRLKLLASQHRDLFLKMAKAGLIEACVGFEEFLEEKSSTEFCVEWEE